MYVYFRLLFLVLKSFFKKKLPIGADSEIKIFVFPNDVDYNLHINNGRYLTLMDLGRFDLTFNTPLASVLWKWKWTPVVGSAEIKFIRPIMLFTSFTLKTRLEGWDEKYFYMVQEFFVKGELCAKARIRAVFLEKGKRVLNARVEEALGLDKESFKLVE